MKKYELSNRVLTNTKTEREVAKTTNGKYRLRHEGKEVRLTADEILMNIGLYSDMVELVAAEPTKKEVKASTKPYFVDEVGDICSRKTRKCVAKTSSGKYRIRFEGKGIAISGYEAAEYSEVIEVIGEASVSKPIELKSKEDITVGEFIDTVEKIEEDYTEELVASSSKGTVDPKTHEMTSQERQIVSLVTSRKSYSREEVINQLPKLMWLVSFMSDLDVEAYRVDDVVKYNTIKFLITSSKYASADNDGTIKSIKMLNDESEEIVMSRVLEDLKK